MLKSVFIGMAVALVLIGAAPRGAATWSLVAAQQTPPPGTQPGQAAPPNMTEMMKRQQQMMGEMKAADAKLDQLVTQMNAATGDAQISAMVQVVNELVRQQKAMHEQMGQMMPMMMGRGMMNR